MFALTFSSLSFFFLLNVFETRTDGVHVKLSDPSKHSTSTPHTSTTTTTTKCHEKINDVTYGRRWIIGSRNVTHELKQSNQHSRKLNGIFYDWRLLPASNNWNVKSKQRNVDNHPGNTNVINNSTTNDESNHNSILKTRKRRIPPKRHSSKPSFPSFYSTYFQRCVKLLGKKNKSKEIVERERRGIEINSTSELIRHGNGYVIRAAVLLPFDKNHLWSLPRLKWSIEAGLSKTKKILSKHEIVIAYRDSRCSDAHGPLAAIDLYYNRMADLFLGPVCDYAVAPVARYSAFWNVPVITGGALADDFRDKKEYKLLTRMTGSYTQVGECVSQFFGINMWSTYSLMFNANEGARRSEGRTECQMMLSAIVQSLKNSRSISWSEDVLKSLTRSEQHNNIDDQTNSQSDLQNQSSSTTHIHSPPNQDKVKVNPNIPRRFFDEKDPLGDHNFTELLLELTHNSRVILVCANLTSVRELLISAAILNLHKGDYAFVLIDLFSSLSKLKRLWYNPKDTDRRNNLARMGGEALKIITLRIRTSVERTADDVGINEELRENITNGQADSVMLKNYSKQFQTSDDTRHVTRLQNEPNGFELAFHDALILYSLAVNETLQDGGQWFNGSEVNRRMWNRSFEGIMGNVKIDQNGDRLADYSLLDMNNRAEFEETASYYGAEQIFHLLPGRHLTWAGNRSDPPLDTPVCGFDGSLCLAEEFPVYPIAIATLSIALVIAVSAGFMLWKYYDTEAKIAEIYWRVKLDERRISTCSRASDIMAGTSPTTKNSRVMYFRSEMVATKAIHVPLVITRELRLEFKKMKDLKNDHLARFIGVSIDPPVPFIVSEFCARGSLHSLLLNSQMKLDNMFRFSLIQDLIKGMSYLHSSYLRYHGNLKSTNCVVDSRFVLKITDYGLHRLRHEMPSKSPFHVASSKIDLWKAPEIMKSFLKEGDDGDLPVEKKQKADVYSFAIICQEIIVQKGTFWIQNASAKNLNDEDICKEILRGVIPPTRPTLQLPEIHFKDDLLTPELFDIIVKCWSEEVEMRPDFAFLKLYVQKIIRSSRYGGNLIENLLSRMEQYASNLEQLVEQKTADWMMEKKTAEDLLFAMLPKSVALKRMRNESVEPERYDSVSIYFSDIVGFTTLTETSTPLQIVTVLNDLYTLFDRIIDDFEVYKVETIGDAYMVASGVPIRNGIIHAREIARMALSLLHSIKSFTIRHRPDEKLLLRIGIHSGNVCACMVGEKMPHYTLVGDTVNTASRMESNGEALKIHVSSEFKNLLDNFKTFQLEERGPIVLKGKKEPMIAWWLVGDNDLEIYIPKIVNDKNTNISF